MRILSSYNAYNINNSSQCSKTIKLLKMQRMLNQTLHPRRRICPYMWVSSSYTIWGMSRTIWMMTK